MNRPDVLPVNQNYRGLSYGDLVAMRANWLFSENPDYQYESEILQMHGNMPYYSEIGKETAGVKPPDPAPFLDRTGDLEERISEGTPILVPAISATYVIGDRYDGSTLQNEDQIRKASKN